MKKKTVAQYGSHGWTNGFPGFPNVFQSFSLKVLRKVLVYFSTVCSVSIKSLRNLDKCWAKDEALSESNVLRI